MNVNNQKPKIWTSVKHHISSQPEIQNEKKQKKTNYTQNLKRCYKEGKTFPSHHPNGRIGLEE